MCKPAKSKLTGNVWAQLGDRIFLIQWPTGLFIYACPWFLKNDQNSDSHSWLLSTACCIPLDALNTSFVNPQRANAQVMSRHTTMGSHWRHNQLEILPTAGCLSCKKKKKKKQDKACMSHLAANYQYAITSLSPLTKIYLTPPHIF